MWKSMFALSMACLLGVAGIARAEDEKKVELVGVLKTGVTAIGGETTGIVIETKTGTFELSFGADEAMLKRVKEFDGHTVKITGMLSTHDGVERKGRKIVAVSKLEKVVPAEPVPK